MKISVPFFYGYSLGIINPEYDPFNPDIKLKAYDSETRRERARLGQDFTERRSYNFQGVRKERAAGKEAHFFDISNWTASYGYSESLHRDFNTNYDRTKIWKAGLNYGYTFSAKPYEPFKKVEFMQKSKWWAIVRDVNISLLPKNIAFSNDVVRNYNERQIRNNLDETFVFQPVYVKNFTWNRNYKLGWDITKNLKLTFNANNRSFFDEANGRVDKKADPDGYRQFKDTVWDQMRTFGKTLDYTHDYSISYNLPLDKIPALDWLSANVKYGGTYNWQRAPLGQENYGNLVQNNRSVNATAQANFTNLYNKVPFFKKVNGDGKGVRGKAGTATDAGGKGGGKAGPEVKAPEEELKPDKPIEEMTKKERRKWERKKRKFEREKRRKKNAKVHPVAGFAGRLLMTVRNVSGTYTQNDGTLLPGYNQDSRILGFNPTMSSPLSGFIFGQQSYSVFGKETGYDFARVAADNNWLVQNSALNRQHTITHSQTITGRGTLEPFKDFTIDLNVNRMMTQNSSDFFRWDEGSQSFQSQSHMQQSTLTYSTISIRTAFENLGANYSSENFENLRTNTAAVSQYLGSQNSNSVGLDSGYANGYGATQQEVVIGAFLSAYTKSGVNERTTNPFKSMPLPNWSISYNGLTKFEFMKKYVKNFVVRHAYTSTVSMAGVMSNLNAETDADGDVSAYDLNNNFIPRNNVQAITLSERFSPLIGFDATWNVNGQGLITKFEYKKDRSATLSLNNNQVTEVLGNEFVIGTGYKFEKVALKFIKLRGKSPENPLNIRFDFTFRDNLTVIRKIVEGTDQATAGQRVVSIKSSVDYNLNNNLTVQLYYDQVITTPKIATSYPTGNLSTGIRFRYNLGGL
jgi:cell surface protein SprA